MKYSLLILFLILILQGCDLFSTRDAELPNQPRDDFQLAVTPEQLIENFKSSYTDKNIQNYLACFSDSSFSPKPYIFFPSSEAASKYLSFTDSWLKKDEEQYFNNLKSKVPKNLPMTISFQNSNAVQQGDSISYTAAYSLSIPFEDSSIEDFYQGELKFFLSRDSRLIWVITSWQDLKTTSTLTWSDLKGRLY